MTKDVTDSSLCERKPRTNEDGGGVGARVDHDPATGEICAGDPSIVLHTNIKMGDKKAAVQILKSTFDFCKVKALIFENVWQFMSSLSKALASGEHFSKVLFSVTLHNITSTDS
jgi:hypothetical protein